MPRKKKPTCFMCRTRPAKKLPCRPRGEPGMKYSNAPTEPIFCSVQCAANHGLLNWDSAGQDDPDLGWHFCQGTGDWQACCSYECSKCGDQEEGEPEESGVEAPVP